MKIRVLILLVAVAVSYASPLRAQWAQAIGPRSGSVTSMAVIGPYLFAGSSGRGVFRSTDNGATWTPINNGLKLASVYALVARGTDLFTSAGAAVYRSTTADTSWIEVDSGLPNNFIYALAANGSNVFAGTYDSGVYRSTNDGISWTAVNTGLTSTKIRALGVKGNNLFAATWDSAVFLSTNNGVSWASVGLANERIYDFAISGTKIFAGSLRSGVYLSTNDGASWTQRNAGLSDPLVYALAVSGPNLIAATQLAIFLSTNEGTSWTKVKPNFNIIYISSLAAKDSIVLAGASDGVYYSSNYGTDWAKSKTGLTYTYVHSLASARTSFTSGETYLFAGTHNGLYYSWDSGIAWNQFGLSNKDVYAFASSSLGGAIDLYYAGTDSGVFRTTNGGNTWAIWNQGLPSTSEGAPCTSVRSFLMSGWGVFAGTKKSGVFLASVDHPIWTELNSGLTDSDVCALLEINSDLFAGTTQGVFRSTNYGGEWMAVGLPNRTVWAFLRVGTNLFAATDLGVFLSTDLAESWTERNNGLGRLDVRALTTDGSNIFAGTNDGAVFLSKDNGINWRAESEGLECTSVNALMIADSFIFAGTSENGIWRRSVSEMISTSSVAEGSARKQSLTIYPNPTTTSTTISITPEASGYAEISIVNMLGQIVEQVYSGELDASEHSFTFDPMKIVVPRGVYECVVRMNGRVQTVPIVVE